jgi:hypothetical protein
MIPSRPLSIGGIIEEGIRIVRKTYWRAALVMLIFAAPGIILIQLGIDNVIDGSQLTVQKITDFSPEAPKLARDYLFSGKSNPSLYTYLYFQYSDVLGTIDSVRTELQKEYPDSVSRAVLEQRLDSIETAYKNLPDTKESKGFWGQIQSGIVILLVGFCLYMLGIFGSTAAHYDLSSRAFEERSFPLAVIIKYSLSRTMWLLIIQYLIIGFAMLFGLGVVIGISFGISDVLGAFGIFAAMGIIFYAIFRILFSGVAMVSEELGPFDAIKRSLELTKGYFWNIVGTFIICMILIFTFSTLIRLPFSFLITPNLDWLLEFIRGKSFDVPKTFHSIRSAIYAFEAITVISALLTASFTPAFLTTIYYDLRTRKDGPLEYDSEDGTENPLVDERLTPSSNDIV